jgi:hypothetical protein
MRRSKNVLMPRTWITALELVGYESFVAVKSTGKSFSFMLGIGNESALGG